MSKHINKIALFLSVAGIVSIIPNSVYAADEIKTVKADAQQISTEKNQKNDYIDKNVDSQSKVKKEKNISEEQKQEANIGWKTNNDGTYSLIDGKGNMIKSDWCKVGGKWYYFNENGIMQNGWVKADGNWFCLNNDGTLKTGWTSERGNWYYLNGDGVMVTGWNSIDGNWYYFNNKGEMSTGWKKINSKWYYFDNSGKMLSNTVVDGCTLGPNGDWI